MTLRVTPVPVTSRGDTHYTACSRYDPVVRTENRGAEPAISLPSMPFTMSHNKPFLIYAARRSSNTRELFHFEFARNHGEGIASNPDNNPVFNRGYTGSGRGCPFSFIPFHKAAHIAAKHHLTSFSLHLELPGIQQGVALKCSFDSPFYVQRDWSWLKFDKIGHSSDPRQMPHGLLGSGLLMPPIDRALQGEGSLADHYLDRAFWHCAHPFNRS